MEFLSKLLLISAPQMAFEEFRAIRNCAVSFQWCYRLFFSFGCEQTDLRFVTLTSYKRKINHQDFSIIIATT